jgi:hypothetical protein
LEQALPGSHAFLQTPQFALSVFVSVQEACPSGVVHRVCEAMHFVLHLPPEQTSPIAQTLPHAPQFALSVSVFAQ